MHTTVQLLFLFVLIITSLNTNLMYKTNIEAMHSEQPSKNQPKENFLRKPGYMPACKRYKMGYFNVDELHAL